MGLGCSLAVGFGHGKMGEKAEGAAGVCEGHRDGSGEEAAHTSLQPDQPSRTSLLLFLSFVFK